jgi:uncharacterized protein (DUF983 family)
VRIFRNKCSRCGHVGKYYADFMDAYVQCGACGNITDLGDRGIVVEEE